MSIIGRIQSIGRKLDGDSLKDVHHIAVKFYGRTPRSWNIKANPIRRDWYFGLIRNVTKDTISFVFFNNSGQLIDTMISFKDIERGDVVVRPKHIGRES